MSKFAFFDFDDTLARGDSVLPYLMYCIRRGYAPWTQAPRAMLAYIKWLINPQCVSGAKETTLSFIPPSSSISANRRSDLSIYSESFAAILSLSADDHFEGKV